MITVMVSNYLGVRCKSKLIRRAGPHRFTTPPTSATMTELTLLRDAIAVIQRMFGSDDWHWEAPGWKAISLANSPTPPILRVPNELLMDIHDHLGAVDSVCFARTCRRAALAANYRLRDIPEGKQFRGMRQRIRKDNFPSLCEKLDGRTEWWGTKKLCCSHCLTWHKAQHFSVDQRQLPPAQRVCLGANRVLRLCSHVTFTHEELANFMETHESDAWSPVFSCWELDGNDNFCYGAMFEAGGKVSMSWMTSFHVPKSIQSAQDIEKLVESHFLEAGAYACPHLDLSEVAACHWLSRRSTDLGQTSCSMSCKSCTTELAVFRWISGVSGFDKIYFRVGRSIPLSRAGSVLPIVDPR
jgi:hypothetical protein